MDKQLKLRKQGKLKAYFILYSTNFCLYSWTVLKEAGFFLALLIIRTIDTVTISLEGKGGQEFMSWFDSLNKKRVEGWVVTAQHKQQYSGEKTLLEWYSLGISSERREGAKVENIILVPKDITEKSEQPKRFDYIVVTGKKQRHSEGILVERPEDITITRTEKIELDE